MRGFGLAQLSHGLAYLMCVASSLGGLGWLLPALAEKEGRERDGGSRGAGAATLRRDLVDADQLSLAAALTGSSLLKHLLTEADKITLSLAASPHEQVPHLPVLLGPPAHPHDNAVC